MYGYNGVMVNSDLLKKIMVQWKVYISTFKEDMGFMSIYKNVVIRNYRSSVF